MVASSLPPHDSGGPGARSAARAWANHASPTLIIIECHGRGTAGSSESGGRHSAGGLERRTIEVSLWTPVASSPPLAGCTAQPKVARRAPTG